MTDAPLPAIPKGTGMKKCVTKARTVQLDVERSGVTTAGNVGESGPQKTALWFQTPGEG